VSAPVIACIGLGANLGDAATTLRSALDGLGALPGISGVQASRLYRSAAWGREDQPDFINACARVVTTLDATELLLQLQALEQAHGRERLPGSHWGPRTLDLDLLLYGTQVIDLPQLQVPHRWMHARAFVMRPLAEIAGELWVPGHGTVDAIALALDTSEVLPIGG
jgi:2-amino-4-hydroxy-6-hydroxymethyldihydropteridine diphosphokinase